MSTPSSFKVFPENEITFNYSPKKHLNSSIYLTSTTDQLLAFKVKTNVPICYVVKPHIGFLSPHSSIEISIIMQPTEYTPQTAAIADKFLINTVSLPNNTDMAALSDPTLFQKLWDSVPKSLVESAKLKVVLKFESNSGNTSVLDKTGDEPMPENRPSGVKVSQLAVPGAHESREELSRSSMMHSFAGDGTGLGLGISKNESSGQNLFSQMANEQPVKIAQSVIMSKGEDIEKDKKRESVAVKEERDIGTTVNATNIEERMAMLEKRVDKIETEKKALSQKWQELTGKTEEQGKMISSLSEDRNKMKEEIKNIKKSLGKGGSINLGNFESWHILLGMIIALILGAFVVRKSE